MFQYLERLILNLVRYFYSLPPVVGLLLLLGPALVLLFVQFQKQKKTYVPGTFSLLFVYAAYHHFFKAAEVIQSIDAWLASMSTARSPRGAVPLLEPLFRIIVGPTHSRYLFEEVLGLGLMLYVGFVIYSAIQDYKKTGIVFSGMSMKSLLRSTTRRPKRSITNELGSGDLASTEQIARWTRASGRSADSSLVVTDLKGSEGIAFKQTKLIIPREERNRHVLVIAKTGSGKTTKVILPILYDDCFDPDRSTIVLDSKPEMWRKLAAMARKYNPDKNILLFNPLDTLRSLSWNILGKIEDDTDCKLIANTIIMATDHRPSLIAPFSATTHWRF